MLTVGGVFTPELTVTETADEVVLAPRLSVATAVMEYVPAATLLQVYVYGEVAFSPSLVVPL